MEDKKVIVVNKREWIYLLILTIALLLFFLPVFTQGRVVFPDLINYYEPWKQYVPDITEHFSHLKSDFVDSFFPNFRYIKQSLAGGDIPLWYDIGDLGKPLMDRLVQFVFNPLYLFMWFMPEEIGFTIASILKVLIAGFGMYFWLKQLGANRGLAVGGAVAFVFSGFNLSWFMGNAATQNLMIPWVFLLIDRIININVSLQTYKNAIYLSLTLAFILFSGFIAGAGHILYIAGFYALICTIRNLIIGKPKTIVQWFRHSKSGFIALGAMVLAIGLAGLILLPSLDLVNVIDITYRKVSNAAAFLPIKTLVQLGLPNYFGNPVFDNWRGVANWNETSSFVTMICLSSVPLGLYYALKQKQYKVLVMGGLAVFCVMVIWRITPLLNIIRKLPIFDSSSNTRLIGPLTFILISIGIYGINNLISHKRNKPALLYYFLLVLALVGLIIYKLKSFAFVESESVGKLGGPAFSTLSIVFALGVIVAFIMIIWLSQIEILTINATVVLISVLLFMEASVFAYRQIPFVPRAYFYPETKATDFLAINMGNGRLLIFDGTFMISGTQAYYGIDTVLTHNLHTVREKELVTLFTDKAWGSATAPMLKSKLTDFTSPIFEFYGVKYVAISPASQIDDPSWKLIYSNLDGISLYENLEFSDNHYYFSSQIAPVSTLETLEQNLEAVSKEAIVLYEAGSPEPLGKVTFPVANSNIEVLVDSGDHNELKVCTDQPGILSVRDSYWPGWEVKVNSSPAHVIQTNYIYRGVYLEKGCSTVTEDYLPNSFRMGAIISGGSLLILGSFSLCLFLQQKRKSV